MRKLVLLIFCLLVLTPFGFASASDITGAIFHGIVTVTNEDTTTGDVATTMDLSSEYLASNNYANEELTDIAIRYSGSDIAFMPGYDEYPWCIWVDDIGASQNLSYDLYTGNVTGGKERYFPDNNGMNTTDHASMEISDNGTIAISAYLDTDKIVAEPYIRVQSYGYGTAAAVPVDMPTGWQANDLLLVFISAYDVAGLVNPTITTPAGFTQLYQDNYGIAEKFGAWYSLATGSEADPTNFNLDRNSFYSYQCLSISSGSDYTVPLCGVTATGAASNPDPPSKTSTYGDSTTMWVVAACSRVTQASAPTGYSNLISDGANSAYVSTAQKITDSATENPGTFGTITTHWAANTVAVVNSRVIFSHEDSVNGGIACYADNITVGKIVLETTGAGATSLSVSGIDSGEYILTVDLSGGTLSLDVGGSSNSTAFGGNIPDSDSDWLVGSSGTPYIEYYKHYVDGVLLQHIEWEYSDTFTDLSGTGNDATPTFRVYSGDADVSATLTSFQPISEAKADTFDLLSSTGILTDTPEEISQMYSELDFEYIPGGEAANQVLSAGEIPEALWWFPFIFMGIAITGLIAYGATRLGGGNGSLLMMCFVVEILLVIFGIMNPIPFWPAILFPIPAAALITSQKHFSLG